MEYITALGLLLMVIYFVVSKRRWKSYVGLLVIVLSSIALVYLVITNWHFISSNLIVLVVLLLIAIPLSLLVLKANLSTRAQSQLKVKLAKAFSLYKYDYRESWLGFNSALEYAHQEQDFYPQTIKALAEMVGSPGGKLWAKTSNRFGFIDHWNSPLLREQSFSLPADLIHFMDRHNLVVDVKEYAKEPNVYRGLDLDLKKFEKGSIKIFVPLRREKELVAIVGLKNLDDTQNLNWEEHDLLKAAGQQMASYLGLYEATSRLYEQREFAAFNRLSTFVVHDLKNVSAQLELITQNANKFGSNPEFIEDSFETVKSANQSIAKMLKQLQRKEAKNKRLSKTYLPDLVEQLEAQNNAINIVSDVPLVDVLGAQEQLLNIMLHLEDNAQQAVKSKDIEPAVAVEHKIERHDGDIYWHIIDQGIGMSEEFMRDKLFKPFETTKGNAGMGVGVYQCRYLLRSNDGDLIIRSRLGEGTHCTVILSVLAEATNGVTKTGDTHEPK